MIRKDSHVIPSDFQGMKKKKLFEWFPWFALIRNDSQNDSILYEPPLVYVFSSFILIWWNYNFFDGILENL
jgi:hypothetical protein